MKRRVNEIGAIAGFEKSGHFFFNKPFGRGYDDGLIFAFAVCDMLDRNPGKTMADLNRACRRPGRRRRCRRTAPTRRNTPSSTRGGAVRGEAGARRARSPASRSAISSPSTASGHGRGRHLGPRARLLEQAGTGRRGREPGVGSAHARDVRGGRPRSCARTPRSGPTIRRSMRDEAGVRNPAPPDLLRPGLRIVFCGTAAGTVSAARGAYYAHPQNRFWSALHASGSTPRLLQPEEFD